MLEVTRTDPSSLRDFFKFLVKKIISYAAKGKHDLNLIKIASREPQMLTEQTGLRC